MHTRGAYRFIAGGDKLSRKLYSVEMFDKREEDSRVRTKKRCAIMIQSDAKNTLFSFFFIQQSLKYRFIGLKGGFFGVLRLRDCRA